MSDVDIDSCSVIEFDELYNNLEVPKFYLNQVCSACPEIYDVYIKNNDSTNDPEYVGYIRVRHGVMRVENSSDVTVLCTDEIKGDGMLTYEESDHFLKKACAELYKQMMNEDKSDYKYFY